MKKLTILLIAMVYLTMMSCKHNDHQSDEHDHEMEANVESDHDHEGETEEHEHEGESEEEHEHQYKTGTVKFEPFNQIIKTSGEIKTASTSELELVASNSGILHFADTKIVQGAMLNQGQENIEDFYTESYANEGVYKYGYLTFSSRYRSSVEALLKLYKREDIKFFLFEQLMKEPEQVLHQLQSFLEVKPMALPLMRENVAGVSRGRLLKFITGLPLHLYQGISRSHWLHQMVPVQKKRKTRNARSSILASLKRFDNMSRKESRKPPLDNELKQYLIDYFNRELKGIEKITGLPIQQFWNWYQP